MNCVSWIAQEKPSTLIKVKIGKVSSRIWTDCAVERIRRFSPCQRSVRKTCVC